MDINRIRMPNVRKTKEGKNPSSTFTIERHKQPFVITSIAIRGLSPSMVG